MKNTRAIFLSMIIVGACGIVGMASGYLYKKTATPRPTAQRNIPVYTPSPTPEPSPLVYIQDVPFQSFGKNFADKFQGEFDYPDELKKLTENDVMPFRCSEVYEYSNIEGEESYVKNWDSRVISDPFTLSVINNELKKKKYYWISICQSKEGEIHTLSTFAGGNGGAENYTDFSTVSADLYQQKQTVTIKNIGAAYFHCGRILAMTQSSTYLSCGGGDGGTSRGAIFQVSNTDDTTKNIMTCETELGVVDCTYY